MVSLRPDYQTGGADKFLARPTSRCILFDSENISFDASLVIYVNSTNIPPIMIINRIYEHQNLLLLVSFLVGLRTYQHPCTYWLHSWFLLPVVESHPPIASGSCCLIYLYTVCKLHSDHFVDWSGSHLYPMVSMALLRIYYWLFLWSSGQSFWLQIQRSRVRFPALPDFLSSSVWNGVHSASWGQLRSYLNKKVAASV